MIHERYFTNIIMGRQSYIENYVLGSTWTLNANLGSGVPCDVSLQALRPSALSSLRDWYSIKFIPDIETKQKYIRMNERLFVGLNKRMIPGLPHLTRFMFSLLLLLLHYQLSSTLFKARIQEMGFWKTKPLSLFIWFYFFFLSFFFLFFLFSRWIWNQNAYSYVNTENQNKKKDL